MWVGFGGYRFVVVCLCFFLLWFFVEKFGWFMMVIYEKVFGFNGVCMGIMVVKFFDNLKVG